MNNGIKEFFELKSGQVLLHNIRRIADALEGIHEELKKARKKTDEAEEDEAKP